MNEGFARHGQRNTKKAKRNLTTARWVNAIGSLDKFLFGNMDHADSVEIDQKLRILKEQQSNNLLTQHKYTNIVEKQYSGWPKQTVL